MAESEHEATLTQTDQSTTTTTGLSITLDSSSSARLDVTREELEKRQLLHSIQLLKLELSQKNLVIETLRNEQASRNEDLQERLSDALHEKKLLHLRLKSMTHTYEEELRELRQKTQRGVVEREGAWPLETPVRGNAVVEEEEEVRESFHLPPLSEEEYLRLRTRDSTSLALREYVRLRCYELLQPVQREKSEVERRLDEVSHQLVAREKELRASQNQASDTSTQIQQLEDRCARLSDELKKTRSHIHDHNFKADHYDTIKRERDGLQREVESQRQTLAELKGSTMTSKEESRRAREELSSTQQCLALLRQDKDYLSRQVSELSRRANAGEERSEALSQQLLEAKQTKERVYEQLLKSREEQKLEYEQRLQSEVESLRARTAAEFEQIKVQTREMYERENRSLQEARDSSCAERDRAVEAEKEALAKYDQLSKDFRQLQISLEGRVSDLQGELRVQQFECERTGLAKEEAVRELRQCAMEREKLREKVEVLNQELWSVQSECGVRVREVEGRAAEQGQRLEVYEKLEKELDDVIMQAAEMDSESDAERVLFSYGFGTSVPSTSRRRMQQSVQLARRVLQLERINVSLRREQESRAQEAKEMEEKLSRANELLEQSSQPHSYLVKTIRSREEDLSSAKESIAQLQRELHLLKEEKAQLISTKNRMAEDLERLLNHREELRVMRQVIGGLQGSRGRGAGRGAGRGHVATDGEQPLTTHQPPPPTLFTKQDPPSWYKRLKQQSQAFPSQHSRAQVHSS